jgi:Ca-activated chloride channel family protein
MSQIVLRVGFEHIGMTVDITADVSRTLSGSGGETTVEVTLEPRAETAPTTRHLSLLIDTSQSMSGNKIENAKQGAKEALEELDGNDYVSVVGFDSNVEVVLPMQKWGDANHDAVASDIDAIVASNGTDIYKGLETARDQLIEDAPRKSHAAKRIVLLSDGQDRYDPATYRELAEGYEKEGLSIIAAGVGYEYDAEVILALANASGGAPIDLSEEDIDQFLTETVSDTGNVIAPNPELKIDIEREFIIADESAYFDAPNTEHRDIDTEASSSRLGLPELEAGEKHQFTFPVLGQPKPIGLTYPLADLRVLDSTGSLLAETSVEVDYCDDAGIVQADVERRRGIAKVKSAVQDPGITDVEVDSRLGELRERGWTDEADKLEGRKGKIERPGDLIRFSE